MRLTRRNTIIALGSLAGGAGVIAATGAFDTVEADRSFEVTVDGDADALLALEATNDEITEMEPGGAGDNDVIVFRLDEQGVNEDAVTWFYDAFEITNNGSNTVDVHIDLGEEVQGVGFIVDGDEDENLAAEPVSFGTGDTVSVDLRINTRDPEEDEDGGYTEPDGEDPHQMTITAESEDAQE